MSDNMSSILAQPFGDGRAGEILLSSRADISRNVAGEIFPPRMDENRKRSCALLQRENEVLQKVCAGSSLLLSSPIGSRGDGDNGFYYAHRFVGVKPVIDFTQIAVCPEREICVALNCGDHFHVQSSSASKPLREVVDCALEFTKELGEQIKFEHSEKFGFLTSNLEDVGTGARFSLFVHLPGLVLDRQMDKVVRAINMCDLTIHSCFGYGPESAGSIFQISNLRTFDVSTDDLVKTLQDWGAGIIEQERNARKRLVKKNGVALFDQISRIYGEMRFGILATEAESLTGLSFLRMACDMKIFPEYVRPIIDDLILEVQSDYIAFHNKITISNRHAFAATVNKLRGTILRNAFVAIPPPDFSAF